MAEILHFEILRKHGQTNTQTHTQTNTHTNRHGHYNTSPSPYGGRGNNGPWADGGFGLFPVPCLWSIRCTCGIFAANNIYFVNIYFNVLQFSIKIG